YQKLEQRYRTTGWYMATTELDKNLICRKDLVNILILGTIAAIIGIYLTATTVLISKDGVLYLEHAQKLQHDPATVIKTQPPGYSFLILIAHKFVSLFIDNSSSLGWIYTAQVLTLLFKIAALIPLYFLGKLLVGSRNSFWAGLIIVMAHLGSDVLREWPHLLFLATGMLLIILGCRNNKWWLFGAVGLISGLGHIIRPECAQVFVYAMLLLLMRILKPVAQVSRSKTLLALIILVVGFALPAAPYMKARGKILPNKVRDIVNINGTISKNNVQQNDESGIYTCSLGKVTSASGKLITRICENLMYFFAVAAVIGLYDYLRKSGKSPDGVLICLFLIFNILAMHLLHYQYNYISRRHCLPLCMILVLFAPAGIEILSLLAKERIFKDRTCAKGNTRKLFIIFIFLGIIIGMPKLFRPIGAGKQGYRTAANWLKKNSEQEAHVFSEDHRIRFYAERKRLNRIDRFNSVPFPYLIITAEKGREPQIREAETWSEQYTGWANPNNKKKQIKIYKPK
ncbi:MAG: hypothetical protein ACYTBV_20310, partial [Planctomycetota bacterium]